MKSLIAPIFCLALASCGGGGDGPVADAASTPPVPSINATGSLLPDCSGCGAVSANNYSGAGIGIWRYSNDSGATAKLDINIAGVAAGKVATLVFSNGSQANATAPSSGSMASPDASLAALADLDSSAKVVAQQPESGSQDAHAQMLEKNRAVASGLMRSRTTTQASSDLASSLPGVERLSFSPALNTPKTWIDNFPATPVSYATSVHSVCPSGFSSGRNVVWWVDPNIVSSGKFTQPALDTALRAMQDSYCGLSSGRGGLAQLNNLLGDVWGSGASRFPKVVQDTPLQDVNVVLLNVPANIGWAGYFFAGNNLAKTLSNTSNEALVFFINADQIKADLNFATSTLIHESTHMVNFYQRAVVRGVAHDTWLEETSAMMTEDIVAPAVISGGYNKIMKVRLPDYLRSGGNVSYLNWPTLVDSSSHYGLGGGFGAFLNRRYGLSIYQQLVTSCGNGLATSTAAARTSYDCLDGLIKANKGVGFSDEFARFGATVFGQLPAAGAPAGYGYPSTTAGGYTLQANNLSAPSPASSTPLSGYAATSQTYQRDSIGAGKTSYVRNGVVVPAHTTLTMVIQ